MDYITMKAHALDIIDHIHQQYPDQLNSILDYTFNECSFEDKMLSFAFPITKFMLNPGNALHGGMMCTILDVTMGSLAFLLAEKSCPTVELSTSFLKPVLEGDTLIVTAKCVSLGRTLVHLTAEAVSQDTGKICGTSQAVFFSGGK